MDAYLLDWANLLLRWLHVITAIAWVGSSFYFVWLDNHLIRPKSPDLLDKGVDGALWAVHGGGFYTPQKYMLAPKKIHTELHWFYWESYSTWLTGFALFTVLYLWNAGTYLVDKAVLDWTPLQAGAAALAFLAAFWVAYDQICRAFGFRKNGDAIVGALVALVIGVASWAACHLFAGRAAFLLMGAMIATAMSANVFFWIIPGQRKVMAQMAAGEPVDPTHGKRAKQRSVHNTYFTLPVLFAMLSNHYSFVYSHPQNWLVLVLMMLAGALIRQFFVMRHGFKHGRAPNPTRYAVAGSVLIVAVAAWLWPTAPVPAADSATANLATGKEPNAGQGVGYATVRAVLEQRCYVCHGAQVQMKNVRLDSPALVRQYAPLIHQQAAVQKTMPLNNATGITPAERSLIAAWFEGGARVD